ncbi:hypothetical protein DFH09DRAFT_953981 [Mycena vulgaris]|nr:hypothetical protein DFH09DRAFT_953981 [Mycena vulgaris]
MAGPPVRVYNEAAPSSPHSGEDISHLPAHPSLPTVGEGDDAAHGEESRILELPGRRRILSWYQSSVEPGQSSFLPHACGPDSIPSPPLPLPIPVTYTAKRPNWSLALRDATLVAYSFLLDSFTRQLYLHLLLRIPSLYFSRVASIFEEAQFSLPQIRHMALQEWNSNGMAKGRRMFLAPQDPPVLPRSLLNFRSSWEAFINSLMREWKTLNIISVLLLSAILTMLQLEGAAHPLIRTSALCSLICALMSLLYGCMYIIRFGTMRKLHKASGFATEAQKDTASIWWNVWVLLAMPATWLAWSIIMFLICIMSFIWLSGIELNSNSFWVSPQAALGLRIGLTVVFSLALMYFVLIVKTFHRYGDALDEEWMRTVRGWVKEETLGLREKDPSHGYVPYSRPASWASLDQDNASRGPSPVARPPLPPSPGQLPLGPEPPMPTQLEPLEPPLRDAVADQVDFFDTGSDPMRLNRLLQPSTTSGLPFLRWNMLYSSQHLLDLRLGCGGTAAGSQRHSRVQRVSLSWQRCSLG